ncbi:MAG: hypothetical protein AB8B92_09110 [Gammaproteobacteria bacterium]
MSYLISNFIFVLAATFFLGLGMGWFMWGRLKKRIVSLENDWRNRFITLDDDYQLLIKDFNEVELLLKDRIEHINSINDEKNDLAIKLNSATNLNSNTGNEIEELKSQLSKTTTHHRIISKELNETKRELETLNSTPDEIRELKTLLGQATQRYNNNGLELNNKNEELISLQNQLESTSKQTSSLKNELDHLRTKLLNRDKDFETQALLFTDTQNKLRNSESALQTAQIKLDAGANQSITISTQLKERDEKILILENQVKLVSKQYKDTQLELADTKKHVPALNNEINSLRERVPSLESSLKQRDSSIAALENEVNRLATDFPPLHDEIETHKKQADDLKQQLNTLQLSVPDLKSTIAARDAHIRELEVFMKDAQNAILKPANGKNGNGKTVNGNGATNGNVVHINGTSKSNKNGSSQANGSSKNKVATHINNKAKQNNSAKLVATNNKAAATAVKPKIKPYGLKKPTRKPDDLKLITGIGETLEKTLHKCGIFYFEQIASFNLKDVNTVDQLLNFRGRIDRDDWIKQARVLMRANKSTNTAKNTNNAATKKTTQRRVPKRKPKMKPLGMKRPSGELDDLQLINGVGPTLEKKLHRLGIYHYEQIAHLTAEDIATIDSKLKTYKGRLKRDKWPMQARRLHKEFYAGL